MSNKKICCGGFFIDDTLKEEDGVLSVVGGGSSSLPEVTSDDNGDVLTVVEGQWDKAVPRGLLYKINVTDYNFIIDGSQNSGTYYEGEITLDKTVNEIISAFENGYFPVVIWDINEDFGGIYTLQNISIGEEESWVSFSCNGFGPVATGSFGHITLTNTPDGPVGGFTVASPYPYYEASMDRSYLRVVGGPDIESAYLKWESAE